MNINLRKYAVTIAWIEFVLLVILGGYALQQNYMTSMTELAKSRDAIRLSDVSNIRVALRQYASINGKYPSCLYENTGCSSTLEGTSEMTIIPKDPETGLPYSYAAFGTGANCMRYHIGTSLERTASQALIISSNAPTRDNSSLCQGSPADFSGLSYASGGQPCNTVVGIAQPTDDSKGDTCYDYEPVNPLSTK